MVSKLLRFSVVSKLLRILGCYSVLVCLKAAREFSVTARIDMDFFSYADTRMY